jgi:hypothetical protein
MIIVMTIALALLAVAAYQLGAGEWPDDWRRGPATIPGRFSFLGKMVVAGAILATIMRLVRGHWW